MPNHLLAVITAHGFGHLSMTAPVLNYVAEHHPVRLTIQSGLSREIIARRVKADFDYIQQAGDFGMIMKNSLDVDLHASFEAYKTLHSNWKAKVNEEAQRLKQPSAGCNPGKYSLSYLAGGNSSLASLHLLSVR